MKKIKNHIINTWQHAGFQKYFKNTGWMFFSKIFSMIISFFITAIVARYLGPEKYGTMMYAVSFVGLFAFLSSLGIDQIVYREILNNPKEENKLLGTSLILKTAGGISAVILSILCSMIFSDNQLERTLIFIISISYIFQSFNIINYSFQSRLENRKLSTITITVNIILSIFKLIIVYFNKGILFLSSLLILEPILYGLFFIYIYNRSFGKVRNWFFDKKTAIIIFKSSLPLMFSSIFALVYARIDQVMIKHYMNNEAVGLYSSAVTLSEVWYFIPTIIVSTFFPAIMNAKNTDKYTYGKRILGLSLLITTILFCISLGGTIFSREVLHIIFGSQFISAHTALSIYIWSGIGVGLGTIIIQFLVAEKLPKIILFISLIGMIINITLNIVLIPIYGINGSALATLISYIIGPLTFCIFKEPRQRIVAIIK